MTIEEAIKILEEEAEFLYGGDEPYNKMAFDMAIEALKDKRAYCMMADRPCFAHGTQIAWCLSCPHISEEDRNLVRKAVEGLDPKTGWIPVSEKPKEEEKKYLVQLDGGGMCSCRWTNVNPIWTELTTDWHWNIFDIPQYCKVVAWMDLEPYREDGEEE